MRIAIVLAPLLLAACAQTAQPPAASPSQGTCQAGPAEFAVGQVATPTVVAQAQRRAGAQRARVLRPGQVVTMEFDAGRLNLDVDAGDRVTRVRCG